MMYEIIAKELKHQKMEDVHPQDYLNFYCLGAREELPQDVGKPLSVNGDPVTLLK